MLITNSVFNIKFQRNPRNDLYHPCLVMFWRDLSVKTQIIFQLLSESLQRNQFQECSGRQKMSRKQGQNFAFLVFDTSFLTWPMNALVVMKLEW